VTRYTYKIRYVCIMFLYSGQTIGPKLGTRIHLAVLVSSSQGQSQRRQPQAGNIRTDAYMGRENRSLRPTDEHLGTQLTHYNKKSHSILIGTTSIPAIAERPRDIVSVIS